MQKQIEEEIEDEIALADEQYQREEEAYRQIINKRKSQGSRKVNWIDFESFFLMNFFIL
jgi:hypothetical protein